MLSKSVSNWLLWTSQWRWELCWKSVYALQLPADLKARKGSEEHGLFFILTWCRMHDNQMLLSWFMVSVMNNRKDSFRYVIAFYWEINFWHGRGHCKISCSKSSKTRELKIPLLVQKQLLFKMLLLYDVVVQRKPASAELDQSLLLHHRIFGPAYCSVNEMRRREELKNNVTFQRMLILGKCLFSTLWMSQ